MVKIKDLYSQETVSQEKGDPCLYERGGGYTNTGAARLIGDSNGEAKEAAKIRSRGDLSCGDHAAIPVESGDYVVEAERHRENIRVAVGIVTGIRGGVVSIQGASEDINRVAGLTGMIDAAIAKTYDYHCRRPYYIKTEKETEQ